MQRVKLFPDPSKEYTIVAFGAHPDDIELGAGGTMLRIKDLARRGLISVEIYYVVFAGSNPGRAREARKAARMLGVVGNHVRILYYDDTLFPKRWDYMKRWMWDFRDAIEKEKKITHIFTHYTGDIHQDHRTVAENTWRIFRDHTILEYEIVKYEGDLVTPNFYVDLGDDGCYADKKIRLLMDCYGSRVQHSWWDERLFKGHMRLRGVEANCIYAEGFHVKKLVW